jgi:hypothetical protein
MSTDPVPDLHSLVDGLPPAELRRILHLVIGELASARSRQEATEAGAGDPASAPRRLSFAGLVEDEPDAAGRSEELLREEFRRRA